MLLDSIFKKRMVCGVDLSSSGKRVCVLALRGRGKLCFTSGTEVPEGADVACAAPPRLSLIRRLESPFSSAGKTRRVLPSLLDVQMPFSLEECSVAFTHLEASPEGKISALASAARRSDLGKYIDDLKVAGLDPMYMDAEGVALWGGSLEEQSASSGLSRIAVLKVESDASTLVLGQNGRLLAAHALSDLDPARVNRLLISAFSSPVPVEWRLCGSQSGEGSCNGLLSSLGRDWVSSTFVHSEPEAFLARSLARRAASNSPDAVNLRQGTLLHKELSARSDKRTRTVAALLLTCGLALVTLTVGLNKLLEQSIDAQERDFLRRASELAGPSLGNATGIYAIPIIERKVSKTVEAAQPFLAPFQTSPQQMLRELARRAADGELLIERASVSYSDISIEGTAPSWRTPELMVTFLKSKGMRVTLDREESLASETVRYTVTAKGGGSWK